MSRFFTNKWSHISLLMVLVIAAVFYSPSDLRWRQGMQHFVFDSLNQIFPRQASGQVVIVDIDDDSLKEIGQWPWPRTEVAKLVKNLTAMGAKVIAFDGVLAEPDRSSPRFVLESIPETEEFEQARMELITLEDHDEILAGAIEESGIFVSGYTFASYSQAPDRPRLVKAFLAKREARDEFIKAAPKFKVAAVFLKHLEDASAGNGSFMAFPDYDGVLRRTPIIFSDRKTLYPSLGLETLRVASGDPKIIPKIRKQSSAKTIDTEYRVQVGEYEIPVERDGLLWMHYRKFNERGSDYVSAFKVMQEWEYVDEDIKDKIVLIGSSAEGLKDLRSTALEPFQPGVEIHANAVEQILQNNFLLRPNIVHGVEALFIFVCGVLMVVLAPFVNVLILGALCFGVMGLAFMGSVVAYVDYKLLLDPFYASLCVFGIFIVSTLLTYLRTERERREVRDAFGLYISKDFMQELTDNPDKLKLGGEIRDLTVMFSDIRSFTTISEGLDPEELIQLMNDFLTPMSDLVMQNRGTIDKYMGDAMMAFWNAPLDDAEHARNACIAALGMQEALEPINKSVKERAEACGKEPVLLNAGIGINTGPCAVGNMGSRQRFAYSTLGDAVNLASRFEGQTKAYGINILIGEETYKQAQDFAVIEADLIQVKGKTKPVRMYILLGDDVFAADESFVALRKQHKEMLESYRAQKFEDAIRIAKLCKGLGFERLDTFFDLYIGRAEALIKNPPGDEWDGVYEALTK